MSESSSMALPWLVVSLEGALATPIPGARVEAMAEAARLDPDDTYQRLWASGFAARCCLGEFSLDQMITDIRHRLGVDLTEAHLMGLWSLAYEPDLDAIAALSATPGFRVGMIADEAPLFQAAFEAYLPEIELLVDRSWFSYNHDALIDDARFYASLADDPELAGSPPTLVATTSSQSDAAEAAGWQVVRNLETVLGANAG